MSLKSTFRIVYGAFLVAFLIYLIFPLNKFPDPVQGSLRSGEPADVETPLRRSYFTDFKREEVISHYINVLNFRPNLRLNYPPEEAQTIIRDQTRSVYLEEIVSPFRQSIFINGFVAKDDSQKILVDGKVYHQKITVKLVNSSLFSRLILWIGVAISGFILLELGFNLAIDVKKYLNKFLKIIFQ